MKYDREVTTITDILETLDKFDNKEEIIEAIKSSLYDIETDYHTEELFRQELDKYKAKEKELREFISKSKNTRIINGYGSGIRELDMKLKTLLEDSILDILDKEN